MHNTLGESAKDYTIGLICALQEEFDAAARMLDAEFDGPESGEVKDNNSYVFGCIGKHYVVVGCAPEGRMGISPAAMVARDMARSFPHLRFALIVGIGGGAPTKENDIRLGDVVVGVPRENHGGVIQYDFGKCSNGGFESRGHWNAPPEMLLAAITLIRRNDNDPRRRGRVISHFRRMDDMPSYKRPEQDRLYRSDFMHQGGALCEDCGATALVGRNPRGPRGDIIVHYGLIASGNSVMKDAIKRDQYAKDMEVLCFEMEAGGLMNNLPCLVIRGICDYSDSHKNDQWHNYAALAAAAYARELLLQLKPAKVADMPQWATKLKGSIHEINEGVKLLKKNALDDRKRKIYQWLSAPDPSSNHNEACKKRQPTTGTWFIESKQFSDWKANPNSFLWLYGIPGCGKTILTSAIVEDISLHCHPYPTMAVVYFYFDFSDVEKQQHEKMIRSLIKQLSMQCANTPKALETLFSSCKDGEQQPTVDDLRMVLPQMVQEFDETFVILDALDECKEREELLGDVEEIAGWKAGKLHLLATSRSEKDIRESLENLVYEQDEICIQSGLVNDDIRTYVHKRLQTDRRLKRWQKNMEVHQEIERTLMDKAGGMFRWAVCQLDALGNCRSLYEIRKALASLPRTLDDTYARILLNISEEDSQNALKILQWLVYSARPLQIEEVAEVIAVDAEGNPRFDFEKRFSEPREVLTICSSLVTTTAEETVVHHSKASGMQIRLAHFSVREYLVSELIQTGPAYRYSIREIHANISIAETCIAYLLQFDTPNFLTIQTIKEFPLSRYAAEHWARHARLAGKDAILIHLLITELFLYKREAYVNWIRLFDLDNPLRGPDMTGRSGSGTPPLYYASLAGLVESARLLLEAGADANTQGGRCGNALQAASAQGHGQIVQRLLEAGANINAQGGDYGNALQAASAGGHFQIAQQLLDSGADANARGGLFGNALQAALAKGHDQIVQQLLDAGADISAQGGHYYSDALQAASGGGQDQFVQRLLDAGTDVNAQGRRRGFFGSALQAASARGHSQIIQRLIEAGADINAQGGHYGSALSAASAGGHDRVVQQLLDAGADINAQGGHSGSALQAASIAGHGQITQQLLEAGANINAQGGYCGNALQAASARGHIQIIQQLLDAGADINAQGGAYNTALQAASARGYDQVVQQLLEAGADVSARGAWPGDALRAASSEGHGQIVQRLLNAGADINARGEESGSALLAASSQGHDQIVQQLLDAGADVNAQGGYYGNALQAASSEGHDQTVQRLLDAGADINAQGGEYGNALQAASNAGHVQIVQQLLEAGADVNAQGGYHHSALQAASVEDHYQIVQQLLEAGADVNAQGGHYGNALQAASGEGRDQIVQQLLEAGADANAQGGYNYNALYAASIEGHDQIVRQLLEAGANTQGGQYGYNPLWAASSSGHDRIVQQLLEAGADVNAQGGLWGNALLVALGGGYDQIVQRLLDAGADVKAPEGHHGGALQAALGRGQDQIVQRLLDAGADINM
ncbi:hypothetical protein FGG08_000204 [Glutinoglossum americanum]|uniref:Ankyrin repeat domain-containing protein 50 n=1 Tax=Glutinoglossum americanum TaxID=1670608 RepID=A0A9P8L672_9PEZI|nr:hypothetical protein FGG08_000204 [Glutinoglossum americanum]